MQSIVDDSTSLVLNSILLSLYVVILGLGVVRAVLAHYRRKQFLSYFFGLAALIAALEMGMQVYQVIVFASSSTLDPAVLIAINIYAMLFEATALFSLGDFWGDTSEILTKSSTEEEIREKKHWGRMAVLLVWGLAFSAFIGYIWGSGGPGDSQSFKLGFLVLGCQGIAVTLVIVANAIQIIQGYNVLKAIRRYEEWVSTLEVHKTKLCALYITSSLVNLLRQLFLIILTTIIWVEKVESGWFLIFIYSAANLPVLAIYLFGFSSKTNQSSQTTLLETEVHRSSSTSSRRQTELSPSRESKSDRDSIGI